MSTLPCNIQHFLNVNKQKMQGNHSAIEKFRLSVEEFNNCRIHSKPLKKIEINAYTNEKGLTYNQLYLIEIKGRKNTYYQHRVIPFFLFLYDQNRGALLLRRLGLPRVPAPEHGPAGPRLHAVQPEGEAVLPVHDAEGHPGGAGEHALQPQHRQLLPQRTLRLLQGQRRQHALLPEAQPAGHAPPVLRGLTVL